MMSLRARGISAVFAFTAIGPLASFAEEDPQKQPDLIQNASFEAASQDALLPEGWSGDRAVFRIDPETARTRGRSLLYENGDSKRYRLCSQSVTLKPGRSYRFGGYVKTRDIVGEENGATFCIEWTGSDGKYLGGAYPHGIKGTRDWSLVEGIAAVPKKAGNCRFHCYVRKGMTGTAWFDDVFVERQPAPVMRTVLLSPVYRGRLTGEKPGPIRLRAHWDRDELDGPLEECTLRLELKPVNSDEVLVRKQAKPGKESHTDIELDPVNPPPGRYELVASLSAPDGHRLLVENHHPVERAAKDAKWKSFIDQNRRLIVDGKPFFPIGMYCSRLNEPDLGLFADSRFNCLMPYGSPSREEMDLADEKGLKVIYSIKDFYAGTRWQSPLIKSREDEEPRVRQRVRQFRDHPALLAWYLNDELPQAFLPQLEAHQRWVEEEDPHHPTWVVLYQYKQVAAYLKTFDVIGTDPYPVGRKPLSEVALYTAETRRQVDGARPLWQVPQVFNWRNYGKDYGHTPSLQEMRSMAWQCICEGANGIIFYCFHDAKRNADVPFETHWANLKQVAAEIDRYKEALLSVEPVPEISLQIMPSDPSPLHWRVHRHENKTCLFVVNNGDETGGFTAEVSFSGAKVTRMPENRSVAIENGSFSDKLAKLENAIYLIE